MRVSNTIDIPDEEIQFSFVRASGPGGQNVNKVASAVQLRFDAANSPSIPDDVRHRLLNLAGKRATDEGVIVVDSRSARSQHRNRDLALSKLRELVRKAERKPRRRVPTAPTAGARERRLRHKHHRSQKKQQRRWSPKDD